MWLAENGLARIKVLHENVNMDNGPRGNRQVPVQPSLTHQPDSCLLSHWTSSYTVLWEDEKQRGCECQPQSSQLVWLALVGTGKQTTGLIQGAHGTFPFHISTICPGNHIITMPESRGSWWSTLLLVAWVEETLFDIRKIVSGTCGTWILKAGGIYEVLKHYLRALPVISSGFRLWSHSPVHHPLKGADLTPAVPHLPLRRHSRAGNRALSLFHHLQQLKRWKVHVLSRNRHRTLPETCEQSPIRCLR